MPETSDQEKPNHFKGKEAIEHVIEAQAKGILSTTEIHGTEIPGHISSGADAGRETAVILLVIWLILSQTNLSFSPIFEILGIFSFSWAVWKAGRSAWLAWSRLERMHRIVEQERWEIQHHRHQERDELKELYRSKGFEGQLLEDVIDVLMADEDRLLKVMVEEELCLSLGTHEHPLKQALGAVLGAGASAIFCLLFVYAFPEKGLWAGSFLAMAVAAAIAASYEGNRLVPAIVWNIGLGALTCGSAYFLFEYIN
jgi:vacuolar iron transporter family protein